MYDTREWKLEDPKFPVIRTLVTSELKRWAIIHQVQEQQRERERRHQEFGSGPCGVCSDDEIKRYLNSHHHVIWATLIALIRPHVRPLYYQDQQYLINSGQLRPLHTLREHKELLQGIALHHHLTMYLLRDFRQTLYHALYHG